MTASRTLMGTAARASLATAFIACGATADFTGMSTEANLVDQTDWEDPDARTLYVISVFADFDHAADHLIAVFGDSTDILSVETSDPSGFWQFDADGSGAPGNYNTSDDIAAALIGLYPSVASDSFVTIGLTNSTDNQMQNIGVEFTSFNDASPTSAISVDNGAWFITPDDPQGTAGNYTGNRVLIGQFTVGEDESVSGSVNLQWRDTAGSTFYSTAQPFTATGDESDLDCNDNGVPDDEDIASGTSADCNDNGIPDECDVADGTSEDCDGNNVPDECDEDCNNNDTPDACDIANGDSTDCDFNGIPDECEIIEDCNDNGIDDACDILNGDANDSNGNGIPDECECAGDVNADGFVNVNDILAVVGAFGPCEGCSEDINGDGVVGVDDILTVIANWGPCP